MGKKVAVVVGDTVYIMKPLPANADLVCSGCITPGCDTDGNHVFCESVPCRPIDWDNANGAIVTKMYKLKTLPAPGEST